MSKQHALSRAANRPTSLMLFSAVLTLLLSSFFLRDGIALSPDGWAYWEGAVSLLQGHGYRYFGGEPLTDWGVLFSLYLAGVQALIGIHGGALRLSVLALACLTSGTWVYLFGALSNAKQRWPAPLLYAFYAATYVTLYYQILLSETLFLLLLGGLFFGLWQLYHYAQAGKSLFLPLLGITIAGILLLLCRNSAVAFLPGLVFVLYLSLRPRNQSDRVLLPLLTSLFVIGSWLGVRMLLDQTGTHPITFRGNYPPLQYSIQMFQGIANLLGPDTLGLGWLVFGSLGIVMVQLLYNLHGQKQQPTDAQIVLLYILFVLLSGTLGLYLLFNLTIIHDPLNGRFLWHLVLGLVGFLAAWMTWLPPNRQRHVVLLVLLLVVTLQLLRTGRMMLIKEQKETPPYIVAPHVTIRPDYLSGPPLMIGSSMLVAPPNYEWIDRHFAETKKAQTQ